MRSLPIMLILSLLLKISNALMYSEHLVLIPGPDHLQPEHVNNNGYLRLPLRILHLLLHRLLLMQPLLVLVLGLDIGHHLPMRIDLVKARVKVKVLPGLNHAILIHGHNLTYQHHVDLVVNLVHLDRDGNVVMDVNPSIRIFMTLHVFL